MEGFVSITPAKKFLGLSLRHMQFREYRAYDYYLNRQYQGLRIQEGKRVELEHITVKEVTLIADELRADLEGKPLGVTPTGNEVRKDSKGMIYYRLASELKFLKVTDCRREGVGLPRHALR